MLQEGAQNRQVGGTNMNAESSRSHAVFVIDIKLDLPDIEVLELINNSLNRRVSGAL